METTKPKVEAVKGTTNKQREEAKQPANKAKKILKFALMSPYLTY